MRHRHVHHGPVHCGSSRVREQGCLPFQSTIRRRATNIPNRCGWSLTQEDCASYERAAEFLNFNGNDLVCLQHEYGIFGGVAGSHILTLLRKLKMPLVTTLHTVLREPDSNQRAVLEEIAQLSDRLIVMSEHAASPAARCVWRAGRKNRHHSRMACPIFPSWIPITSRICLAPRANLYCSHSACCLPTKESKT